MEMAREEVDNQQAVRGTEAHVLAPEIDDLAERTAHDLVERAGATSNPIASRERAGERVSNKGKKKVNEKMKELVYIRGVPLVNLDDYDVTNNKLLYDSSDSDDNISPNADGVGVRDGLGSCSQTMDANVESTSKLMSPEVGKHSEPHTMPTTSINNPLFNALDKALHPDVVVVKQEAGWFQLYEEKRQRKTTKKLAAK